MKLKATHAEKLQYGFIFHVAFAILAIFTETTS